MNDRDVVIRRLHPDEWELFRDLTIKAKQTDPVAFGDTLEMIQERDEATWRQWIEKPYVIAAEVDGTIAARVTLREDPEWSWMINGVYTNPGFRRLGLSKKLFDRAFEIAKEKSVKKIVLKVNSSQEAACELYQKLGFKIVDTYHRDVSGVDEYVMEYTL